MFFNIDGFELGFEYKCENPEKFQLNEVEFNFQIVSTNES